jgi:hypothetical protein
VAVGEDSDINNEVIISGETYDDDSSSYLLLASAILLF